MLNQLFKLSQNHTHAKTEILAGMTTFLTMAYVIIVNPILLSQAGMDKPSVFMATCLVAIFGTLVMGLLANYPLAVAPSMSLAVYFVFTVVISEGYPWQEVLGAVFMSGVLFLILSFFNFRQAVVKAIPLSMKMSLTVGVGLFLGFIALKNAGVVVASDHSLVRLGQINNPIVLFSFIGFIATVALERFKLPGSIIIGILLTTALSISWGITPYHGLITTPPAFANTAFHLDLSHMNTLGFWVVTVTMFYVAFFDCTGTLIGVTQNTHLVDAKGNMKHMRQALMSDSLATMFAGLLGTSAAGTYLESATGIKAGGRTGLTSCVVAVLFIICLFFSPLIETIPTFATAPALLFVACLMTQNMSQLDWSDLTEIIPCILTIILMPLTFSIASGVAVGLVTYVIVKIVSFKWKDLNAVLIFLAALSLGYLYFSSVT